MEIWKLITAVSLTKAPQMQQTCEKARVVALTVETELFHVFKCFFIYFCHFFLDFLLLELKLCGLFVNPDQK